MINCHVCLIDDNEIDLLITRKILEATQMTSYISTFSNGLNGIEFLKNAAQNPDLLPDMILLDLNMPVMDGWEFMEEYRQLLPKITKNIAIYIVTSLIPTREMQNDRPIGAVTGFIVKPVTRSSLVEILKKL